MLRLSDQKYLHVSQFIFVVAFVFGLCSRVYVISTMQIIQHDDAISYITANNHHLDYTNAPFRRFVPNQEWQALLTPDEFLPLASIASGLAMIDIHPPLYFWLLHIAVFVTGDTLHTGALLNVILELLILLVLFRFARELLGASWQAYLVCAIWYLGAGMLDGTFASRQYVLASLFTIVLSYITYIWYIRPQHVNLNMSHVMILVVVSAGGMLTLYYFALVILTHFAMVGVWSLWHKDYRIFFYVSGLFLGAIIFVGLFPQLFTYIQHLFGQHVFKSVYDDTLTSRIVRLGGALMTLFFTPSTFGRIVTVIMLGAVAIRTLPLLRLYLAKKNPPDEKTRAMIYLVCITLCLIGLYSLLYLQPTTPTWSVGRRYYLSIWLFVAFVPTYGLRAHIVHFAVMIGFIAMMLLGQIRYTLPLEIEKYQVGQPTPRFESPIIINNEHRGVVLPFINYLDSDAVIYASNPMELINNQDVWLPEFLEHGGTYIETTRYQATEELNQQVQQIFSANNLILGFTSMDWKDTQATVYRIKINPTNG